MKLIIDTSVAEKWYVPNPDTAKALRLRIDFHAQLHELLAPDTLLAECAGVVVNAEKKTLIDPGEAVESIRDLLVVGIAMHASAPLLRRAAEISFLTRLTVASSLYVALAEQMKCQLLTAQLKVIRATRKHFSFVLPFANLP
jgi:predicted nucleic acid-binding protein